MRGKKKNVYTSDPSNRKQGASPLVQPLPFLFIPAGRLKTLPHIVFACLPSRDRQLNMISYTVKKHVKAARFTSAIGCEDRLGCR